MLTEEETGEQSKGGPHILNSEATMISPLSDLNTSQSVVSGEPITEKSADGHSSMEKDVIKDDNKEDEYTEDVEKYRDNSTAQDATSIAEDYVLTQDTLKKEKSSDSAYEKPIIANEDTAIAAEAVKDENDGSKDGFTELKRLRELVFASRGSRSNLPAGWDDDDVVEEGNKQTTASTSKPTIASQVQGQEKTDEAAQRMLQRAIDVVGQYASDSDSDSDSDDDSDSSSSSSSASTSQSNKPINKGQKKKQQQQALSEDEEEGGGGVGPHGPTTKNEVIEPTVDLPPYSIVPMEKEIRPLGKIHSIVDCVVVVAQDVGKAPGQPHHAHQAGYSHGFRPAPVDMHGQKGEEEGEYSVLDTGSLLTFADRNVLGVVFETFGSVLSPLYALRYSSASQVNKDMIKIGKQVFYVPSDSTYVLTRSLRALGKGSDASNLWDEEVGDDEKEFSDDEAEAEHKRNNKAAKGKGKKRGHPEQEHGRGSNSGGGGWTGSNGSARPIKHSLPMRPAMAPPAHRDAANSQNNMILPYDDDESNLGSSATSANPSLPAMQSAPVAHDPYAMWAYQQQQQQHQQYQHSSPTYPQHQYPTGQLQPPYYYSSGPPQPSNDSYDPQQPHFDPSQTPSWPHPPSY